MLYTIKVYDHGDFRMREHVELPDFKTNTELRLFASLYKGENISTNCRLVPEGFKAYPEDGSVVHYIKEV